MIRPIRKEIRMVRIAALLFVIAMVTSAYGQSSFPTAGGGGARVQGIVKMCIDGTGNAFPRNSSGVCTGASQANFPSAGGGGPRIQGNVLMCINGSGNAIPSTAAGQCQ